MPEEKTVLKKIMYTREDGGLSIVHPASKEDLEKVLGPLTAKQYRDHVWERSVPKGLQGFYVEDKEIPEDRYFRDSWMQEGKKIAVNMVKARAHHMNNIRKARDKKLSVLDIEAAKGKNVQDEKQLLRDIPQNFNLTVASTPEELKALWPEQLIEEKD